MTNMIRLRTVVFVAMAAAALSGCLEPSAEKTAPADAQMLADALVYVKAKNGLCFGVGTTLRVDTGAKLSYTNQVVHVPCAMVGF